MEQLIAVPSYVSSKIGSSIEGLRAAFAANAGVDQGADVDAIMGGGAVVLTPALFVDDGVDPYLYDLTVIPPAPDPGRYAAVCREYSAIDRIMATLRANDAASYSNVAAMIGMRLATDSNPGAS